MISPELLRRYPFFRSLNDAQLRNIAMVAEEMTCERGTTIFVEGGPVEAFYVLLDGRVDLYHSPSSDPLNQLPAGEVDVGEPFGISALIEPHMLTATARATKPSHILKIDGAALRGLCQADSHVGYALMCQVAKFTLERLHFTRVQLAAAHA
jgi:CRP/FNR family cyclic AMP-dependent transcriptional regulator